MILYKDYLMAPTKLLIQDLCPVGLPDMLTYSELGGLEAGSFHTPPIWMLHDHKKNLGVL